MTMNNKVLITMFASFFILFNFILLKKIKQSHFFLICYILNFFKMILNYTNEETLYVILKKNLNDFKLQK